MVVRNSTISWAMVQGGSGKVGTETRAYKADNNSNNPDNQITLITHDNSITEHPNNPDWVRV